MRYLAAIALAAACTFAQAANFVSIHQAPLRIALPPAAGSYDYPIDNKVGFQQQYSPQGATGCAIGFPVTGCAFPGGGSLSLPEYTGYKLQNREFKVYIPAGTKSFLFSGYAPQRANSAFVIRYGKEPTRVAPLNDGEYSQAQINEKIDTSFKRAVTEDVDHFVVHDGGGTLRFMGGQLDAVKGSTDQGRWLYVRQLQGEPLYDVQGALDVDMPKYAAGYSSITWSTSTYPDPVESASPVTPTNPTNPTNPTTPAGVVTSVISEPYEALKLDITLTQTDVPANSKASVWIAAYIPMPNLFYTGVWFFRTPAGWNNFQLGDIETAAYASQIPNSTTLKFTQSFDFLAEEFNAYGIEIFMGYKINNGAFVNKGKIWPK